MFKAYMNTSHAHIRSDHTETRRHERPGHIENGDNDHLAALARENADALVLAWQRAVLLLTMQYRKGHHLLPA